MPITLPLDKMTLAEKQEAMEILWQDLYGHEEEMLLPEWQADVLREREAATARGENPRGDFEEAMNELLDEFKCA